MEKEKQEKWEKLIEEYSSSGQRAKQWCEANNQKIGELRYWNSMYSNKKAAKENDNTSAPKEKKANKKSVWCEVSVKEKAEEKNEENHEQKNTIQIKIGNFTVVVPVTFQKKTMKEICEVLKSLC